MKNTLTRKLLVGALFFISTIISANTEEITKQETNSQATENANMAEQQPKPSNEERKEPAKIIDDKIAKDSAMKNSESTADDDTSSTTATAINNTEKSAQTDEPQANKQTMAPSSNSGMNIVPPSNLYKQHQEDIKHYLNHDQFQTISIENHEYFIFIDTYTTAINKGVIILIPDWQQPFLGASSLGKLRQFLADKSWTTITVQPPEDNSDTDYSAQLTKVLAASLEKAKDYPGPIIFIAQGQQAAYVSEIFHKESLEKPAALVMLSAYGNDASANTMLNQSSAISTYPLLDLLLKHDHPSVLPNSLIRKKYINNAAKEEYRQKQLNNQYTGLYPSDQLGKEIIGWLHTLDW